MRIGLDAAQGSIRFGVDAVLDQFQSKLGIDEVSKPIGIRFRYWEARNRELKPDNGAGPGAWVEIGEGCKRRAGIAFNCNDGTAQGNSNVCKVCDIRLP
jgi:hypothetical protein